MSNLIKIKKKKKNYKISILKISIKITMYKYNGNGCFETVLSALITLIILNQKFLTYIQHVKAKKKNVTYCLKLNFL